MTVNKSQVPSTDENDKALLIDCGLLISSYLNDKGKAKRLQCSIRRLVRTFYHRYCIERIELQSIIFVTFLRRNRHLKYDPERSPLESYVAWFVYYSLLTILSQCKQSNTISLSELDYGDNVRKQGMSTDFMERRGLEGLVNKETPEDLLIWKEFLQEICTFFGKHDWEVLIGINDRKTEAQRLGIDYDVYRKRLLRRCTVFKTHIQNIGYSDYTAENVSHKWWF